MEDFYRKMIPIEDFKITITKDFHRLSVYRLTTPEKRNCRGCENLKIFCNMINVVVIYCIQLALRTARVKYAGN